MNKEIGNGRTGSGYRVLAKEWKKVMARRTEAILSVPMICPRGSCNSYIGETDGHIIRPVDAAVVTKKEEEPNGVMVYDLRCPSCGKEWRWPK